MPSSFLPPAPLPVIQEVLILILSSNLLCLFSIKIFSSPLLLWPQPEEDPLCISRAMAEEEGGLRT